jgi:hypothetical protein
LAKALHNPGSAAVEKPIAELRAPVTKGSPEAKSIRGNKKAAKVNLTFIERYLESKIRENRKTCKSLFKLAGIGKQQEKPVKKKQLDNPYLCTNFY